MKKLPVLVAASAGTLLLAAVVLPRWPRARVTPAPAAIAPASKEYAAAPRLDSGQPIQTIPTDLVFDPRRVALGRRLFDDSKLSSDGSVSCASCHDLSLGGADGRRVSTGVGGAQGTFNSPTVLNVGLNFAQFWDGRAATLEEQIEGPLTHPGEMGSTMPDVMQKLHADPSYVAQFAASYSDGLTQTNFKDAIATFERSLVTPNSRFDRFLKGDAAALTTLEQQGFELFREVGCTTCHQGANMGGNSFQRFGVASNYFEDRGAITTADLGRFNITRKERDKYKFKVPTLRNVAKTAPYFHDGSVETLNEAVAIMARYQLGLPLDEREVALIVAFLRTLDGEYAE